jgi:hypothetical protein
MVYAVSAFWRRTRNPERITKFVTRLALGRQSLSAKSLRGPEGMSFAPAPCQRRDAGVAAGIPPISLAANRVEIHQEDRSS